MIRAGGRGGASSVCRWSLPGHSVACVGWQRGGACGRRQCKLRRARGRRPRGLAVDAATIYWANEGSGEIVAYDRATATRRVLASGQAGVTSLALDEHRVYWTTSARVMRVAK